MFLINYSWRKHLLTVKDARNNVTTNTYDTAGNLLTTTDSLGNVTSTIYSVNNGQPLQTADVALVLDTQILSKIDQFLQRK